MIVGVSLPGAVAPQSRGESIAPVCQSDAGLLAQSSYVGLVQVAHFLSLPPSLMMTLVTVKFE